jgi:DNA-binding Lrp family transcriptional regulator
MEAFVLVRAVGDHRALMRTLARNKRISRIYNIAGDNDILVEVNSKNIEELKDILNGIRSRESVLNTTSYIALLRFK